MAATENLMDATAVFVLVGTVAFLFISHAINETLISIREEIQEIREVLKESLASDSSLNSKL